MARELAALKTRIGSRIKARRRVLKMSQEELAFEVGISPTYLSQIESGNRNISLEVLFNLAAALKLDLPGLVEA
jgi:XRE family transcriptional regulator, aerobic/anaerobic benzoate catabolism transcriptional regulator